MVKAYVDKGVRSQKLRIRHVASAPNANVKTKGGAYVCGLENARAFGIFVWQTHTLIHTHIYTHIHTFGI